MSDNIIHVENLVKKYGDLAAVNDITFTVATGEIFGFLGPNGAGKTTTINILCTLTRPTAGKATIAGLDVVHQQSQVRQQIGLVFQDPSLDERLSGMQNMRFHALVYNVPGREREKRIEELLNMVELWDKRNNEVRTYSGGMKRRLELARGLLHHPKVLFLDEPTLGLDPQTRNRIWEYILGLRQKEGTTIFLTTHYMDEADKADRIAIIDYGKLVAMDTPARLKEMVSKDIVHVKTENDAKATEEIRQRYHIEPLGLSATPSELQQTGSNNGLTFEVARGEEFLPVFLKEFGTRVLAVTLHRPSLEDVFLKLTGRQIRPEDVTDTFKAMVRAHGRRMRR